MALISNSPDCTECPEHPLHRVAGAGVAVLLLFAVLVPDSSLRAGDEPESPRTPSVNTGDGPAKGTPDRFICVSQHVASSAAPETDEHFRHLKEAGYSTIVSVDGATPDVEAAARHGLRYIHIPVGYDGIDEQAVLSLRRLTRETRGPWLVHCHHGRHRGPAAAAVLSMLLQEADAPAAGGVLRKAGTSPDYPGLWRSVREFRMPDPNADLPELVSSAPASLATSMARTEFHLNRLEQMLSGNRNPAPTVPSARQVSPDPVGGETLATAVLLHEELFEADRLYGAGYSAGFREELGRTTAESARLTQLLRVSTDTTAAVSRDRDDRHHEAVRRQLARIRGGCRDCHRQYRDFGTEPLGPSPAH